MKTFRTILAVAMLAGSCTLAMAQAGGGGAGAGAGGGGAAGGSGGAGSDLNPHRTGRGADENPTGLGANPAAGNTAASPSQRGLESRDVSGRQDPRWNVSTSDRALNSNLQYALRADCWS